MKKIQIVFLCALIPFSTTVGLDWTHATVDRVIDAEHFVTRAGDIIKIIGYDGPDPYFPAPAERGMARRAQRLLKLLLENESVQLLAEARDQSALLLRHVKLHSGQRLAEFLIERGYGRADTEGVQHFSQKIKQAELFAREAHVGIWGGSSLQKGFRKQRQIAGRRAQNWKKKNGHHCQGATIGRVAKVICGDLIEMEDGVRVRLLGINSPAPEDNRRGFACFGRASRDYLTTLILGKKVRLVPDRTELNDKFEISRYVWLLGDPKQFGSDTLINQKMIEDGFGRSDWHGTDNRYKNEFETLQRQVYADPRGAWVSCSREILKK